MNLLKKKNKDTDGHKNEKKGKAGKDKVDWQINLSDK